MPDGSRETKALAGAMRRMFLIGAVLLLVLVGISCGAEFDPAWRVQGYRLLAIQATPPVLQEGETASLSAIDYQPGNEDITYTWEWCPFETSAQNQFKCPEFQYNTLIDGSGDPSSVSALSEDAGTHADAGDTGTGADASPDAGSTPIPPGGDDPFVLGNGETVQFPYPGTEQQVLTLCREIQQAVSRAGENSPLAGRLPTTDCSRGYQISIRLVAEVGDRHVVAKKNIELSTGSDQINSNPVARGIEIRPAKTSDIPKLREQLDWVVSADVVRSNQWVPMPDGAPLPLVEGQPFDLRASVREEDIEEWRPPAPEGSDREELPPELEIWQFQWFTTIGDLAESSRLYDPDLNSLRVATRSGITVHADQLNDCRDDESTPGCVGHLWLIIRDGRLGLDWVERTYSLPADSQ